MESDFYLRYYVGHKGKFGHEFLEFEFRPDGKNCLPSPGSKGWAWGRAVGRPGGLDVRGTRKGLTPCGADWKGTFLCLPH